MPVKVTLSYLYELREIVFRADGPERLRKKMFMASIPWPLGGYCLDPPDSKTPIDSGLVERLRTRLDEAIAAMEGKHMDAVVGFIPDHLRSAHWVTPDPAEK